MPEHATYPTLARLAALRDEFPINPALMEKLADEADAVMAELAVVRPELARLTGSTLTNDDAAGIIISMLAGAAEGDLEPSMRVMADLSREDLRKMATIMLGMLYGNTAVLAKVRGLPIDRWIAQARQALVERRLS